jgi:putative ABC transport system permease protein
MRGKLMVLIAIQNIIKNRKRALLCMISGVVGITLLVLVGQMGEAIQEANLLNAYQRWGKFSGRVIGVKEELDKLRLDNMITGRFIGLEGHSQQGFQLVVSGWDTSALELANILLKQGSWPQNSDEICIEEWAKEKYGENLEIGDFISIEVNGKYENYKIIGFLEDTFIKGVGQGSRAQSIISMEKARLLNQDGIESLYIGWDGYKSSKDYEEKMELELSFLARQIKEGDIEYYPNLPLNAVLSNPTSYPANSMLWVWIFLSIFLGFCIYNIFQIVGMQRYRQYGILRCLGADLSYIIKSLLIETLILASVSAIISSAVGLFITPLGLSLVSKLLKIGNTNYTISVWNLVISLIFGVIMMVLSAIYPAIKCGKISPLEAVRQVGDAAFKHLPKDYGQKVEKAAGIYAKIAYKNMWFNSKKTVSLILVIVLGVSVSAVTATLISNMKYTNKKMIEEIGDFSIQFNSDEESIPLSLDYIKLIQEIEGVQSAVPFQMTDIYKIKFDLSQYNIRTDQIGNIPAMAGEEYIYSDIYGYNQEDMTAIELEEGHLDFENPHENIQIIINPELVFTEEPWKVSIGDIIEIQGGDDIILAEVAGITRKLPYTMGGRNQGGQIVMSKTDLEKLTNQEGYGAIVIKKEKDAGYTEVEIKIREYTDGLAGYNFISYASASEDQFSIMWTILIVLNILSIVILVLSWINIISTIVTSIIVREKEFGLIRVLGASRNDIYRMLFFEGGFWGISSSIWSILFSSILIVILYQITENMHIRAIPYGWYAGIILINFITCVLGAMISAKQLLKKTPVELVEREG